MFLRSKSCCAAWFALLAISGTAAFAAMAEGGAASPAAARTPLVESLLTLEALLLALAAFVCEYVDATLGMGYGTILSPILIGGFGYRPLDVVPAVLFSQFCTGIFGGIAHHKAGNVSLTPGQRPFNVAMVLVVCGVGGGYVAARIATAIHESVLKLIIALIVLAMGVLILLLRNYRRRFSWRKIAVLGAVASFNKVISGGGYGPVIVAGQIVSGVDSKHAVGVTALAEGLTCAFGVVSYLLATGLMDWSMAVPMTIGALLSVPLAALSVKFIPPKKFTTIVGGATLFLGVYSVYKCWPEVSAYLTMLR